MSETTLNRRHELERIFEPVERQAYVDLYEALPDTIASSCGISWSLNSGRLRLTCEAEDHPFFNRVMGVCGSAGNVVPPLEEIVEHYRERGVGRWMLQVAPEDGSTELSHALSEGGLVPLRGWAKHAGLVSRIPRPVEDPRFDLRVELIGRDRAHDWASVLAGEFGFPAGSEEWPSATVGLPGWSHYVVYDVDTPVACAALIARDSVGTLNFAATLESHRRRGAQSALIAARIQEARRSGLEWLVTETDEELPDRPNPSYRNVIRLGLPVRYVRANWGPPSPVE